MIKPMNRWTELLGPDDREINTEAGGAECKTLTGCESLNTSINSFKALGKQWNVKPHRELVGQEKKISVISKVQRQNNAHDENLL